MKKWTVFAAIMALPISAGVTAGGISHTAPPGFETPEIRAKPIAGVYNKYWYNYRSDVMEAEKELGSDLRRATDREDRWDAWDEWQTEVVDADKDYVKVMRKKGYRSGRVTVG